MSLSDESFPEHDLHITTIDRKCNVSLCTSLSAGDNDGNISASTSGQSLSGNSRETTQSDPAKNPEIRDEEDYAHKVRSCQDLHSAYTKRRYSHVKSKVREFIESQKAEEEHRRSAREYIRRMSIPEAINSNGLELQNLPQKPMSCLASVEGNPSDIDRDLVEKEQEMMCLKALNEYLQSSLQEKMIEATRLRRRLDGMRIELMNAKDKAKRHSMHSIGIDVRNHYSPRLSLPTLIYKLPRNTTGTQTDFVQSPPDANNNSNSSSSSNAGQYESKNVATIQPITLNFSTDNLGHYQRQMRRRPNSNPSTPTGNHTADSKPDSDRSDSAIDTEEGDSSSENVLREQFMISEKGSNDTTSSNLPNQKKKRRYFKRKWKWIFGSCGKCSDQKNNSSFGEQYSQTPLLDSAFADRLRPLDNNTSL